MKQSGSGGTGLGQFSPLTFVCELVDEQPHSRANPVSRTHPHRDQNLPRASRAEADQKTPLSVEARFDHWSCPPRTLAQLPEPLENGGILRKTGCVLFCASNGSVVT